MTTAIAVPGATGRMGRELLTAASTQPDYSVAVATSRTPEQGPIDGIELAPTENLATLLADRQPDVLIDFTTPAGTLRCLEMAVETETPMVIGTTGFKEDDHAQLQAAADRIPILKAANFARGIQALLATLQTAVQALPGYDIEVVETHHNGKQDAPSGTAQRLVETIEAARDDSGQRRYGREGTAPRSDGEIGIHALRAGDITGKHEILLANNNEELRVTHRAEDRGVFAAGALDAADWLVGRQPGWYQFSDLLE